MPEVEALRIEVMGEVWSGLSRKQNSSAVLVAEEVARHMPTNVGCLPLEPVVKGVDQELRQATGLLHEVKVVPTLLVDIGA